MPLEIIFGHEILFFLIGFVTDVGFLVAARTAFCKLVDHEYLEYPEQWRRDGKPTGGQVTRHAVGFWDFSSGAASGNLWLKWYWHTPSWAVGDITAITYLSRFRRWSTVSFIFSVLLFIVGFIFSRWLLVSGAN